MNEVIIDGWITLTPWKLVGYLGVLMFGSRWLVQLYASRRKGRPTFPRLFWGMSLIGSVLTLTYFTFGKNDSVGIMSNIFPAFVASYNFFLDLRSRKEDAAAAQAQSG